MVTLKKRGFTLVELLTVVAIIALLIGILVPAVNQARKIAVKTSVKAQLSGVSQGIEMFRTDFGYYPSSVPQDTDGVDANAARGNASITATPVNGAHRLAFALLGRDQQGCPAKRGPSGNGHTLPNNASNTGPDSLAAYYYSTTPNGGLTGATLQYVTTGNWGNADQKTARKGPYIDPKGFGIVKDTSVGEYANVLTDKYDKRVQDPIGADADYLNHSTILFYAANERGTRLYTGAAYTTIDNNSIYYPQDNERIVRGGLAKDTTTHFKDGYSDENFFKYVEDEKALVGTAAAGTHRPYNPETFLLVSRGYDATYGTDDDVMNWGD
jgi:prepilin-type N-terminal cleavage/methylation domain-containing protein